MGAKLLPTTMYWCWRILYGLVPGAWHFAFGSRRERVAAWLAGKLYRWGEAMEGRLPGSDHLDSRDEPF